MSSHLIHNPREISQSQGPDDRTNDALVQTSTSQGRKWSFLSALSILNPKIAIPAAIGWGLGKLPFAQAQYHSQCADTGFIMRNAQNYTLHVEYIARIATHLAERSKCCNEILPSLDEVIQFLEANCPSSLKIIPGYHSVTRNFDVDPLTRLVVTLGAKSTDLLICLRDAMSGTHNIETIKTILNAFWTPCMDQKIEESERSIELILGCLTVGLVGAVIGVWYGCKYELNVVVPPCALEVELEDESEEPDTTPQEIELQELSTAISELEIQGEEPEENASN